MLPGMVTAAVERTRATRFPYIRSLDGLRGLLVFPVAAFHFSLTAATDPADRHILAPGAFFAPSAFFALSGFLITSLLMVEHERTGSIDGRGFWARRFRRLLPASVFVVLAVVAVGAVLPQWWGPLPVPDIASALFSVQNWWSIHLANTDQAYRLLGPLGVYWSLAVEEQFYLGLFLVVFVASRTRHMIRWLTGALVTIGTLSIISLVVVQSSPQREFFGTDSRASELVAGCLVAVAFHHWGWPKGRWWGWAAWIALAATALAWLFVWEDDSFVLGGALALISIPNVFLICGATVEGGFQRFLGLRPLVELGRISYPVYLVHWPIGLVMNPVRMGFGGLPLIVARFAVSVAVGYGITRLLEKPLRTSSLVRWPRGIVVWGTAVVAAIGVSWATAGWS